ncbi:Caltractin [Symbiodinium natans]|uniref:Caltractin protein n=1 Tax=Symbiodinium natans TaxID=878477 RepID=A0A812NL52_9DINO|nr:Caltractin [Symbiodinium natans]
MEVDDRDIGRIVGRGGCNIRDLQEGTKCKIITPNKRGDNDDPSLRKVIIQGSKEQIAKCKEAINGVLMGEEPKDVLAQIDGAVIIKNIEPMSMGHLAKIKSKIEEEMKVRIELDARSARIWGNENDHDKAWEAGAEHRPHPIHGPPALCSAAPSLSQYLVGFFGPSKNIYFVPVSGCSVDCAHQPDSTWQRRLDDCFSVEGCLCETRRRTIVPAQDKAVRDAECCNRARNPGGSECVKQSHADNKKDVGRIATATGLPDGIKDKVSAAANSPLTCAQDMFIEWSFLSHVLLKIFLFAEQNKIKMTEVDIHEFNRRQIEELLRAHLCKSSTLAAEKTIQIGVSTFMFSFEDLRCLEL